MKQGVVMERSEWIRRKLRCMRLKQRKRGWSVTAFLVRLGVPHWRARKLGGSGRGWWRLAGSPQATEAMSNQWFREQGLVSLIARYLALQHLRRTAGYGPVRPVVWEDGGA